MKSYLLSVDDIVLMEVLEGQKHVCRVKCRKLELEPLAVAQIEMQLATMAVIEHKVETLSILESILELDYEGVLSSL